MSKQRNTINLNDPSLLSSRQACQEWGINDSTLRKRINDFPDGTIRKFGSSWVVTREGMSVVFGQPKAK
ncbi:helix-turn-helix domain-containing protein [Gottfriedia sp. NPDC056225]|uniref:helix-turn-helix domain-containing protein n=1 Tax=Gottfriedia sp. NPDC056225 TaxID=3345751 RepID=UPI001C207D8F